MFETDGNPVLDGFRCRQSIDDQSGVNVIPFFASGLVGSGYGEKTRRMVTLAGLKGFERMKREDELGIRRMYRRQEEGKERRWAARISGKADWFKVRNKEEENNDEGTSKTDSTEAKGGGTREERRDTKRDGGGRSRRRSRPWSSFPTPRGVNYARNSRRRTTI